jgi:ribosome biogenesis protein Nip4
MRVKEVKTIENELIEKIDCITIQADNESKKSLEKLNHDLAKIPSNIWGSGKTSIKLKVFSDGSEAIIELGKDYLLEPSLENLNLLRNIFGITSIKI